MVTSATSACKRQTFTVSEAVGSTNGKHAINPFSGDLCVVYQTGTTMKTSHAAIYRRVRATDPAAPLYSLVQRFVLGLGALGIYDDGAGVSTDSCEEPDVVPIADGFAAFWFRKNTNLTNITMTIGAQVEMAKLVPLALGYQKFASATAGKGYVLDNQIIAGDAGGHISAAWNAQNLVGVVYGHQLDYTDVGPGTDHNRTASVRAAYLDFSANGKPSIITGGNRTAGSVSDATDGGFAAGATQIYLLTAIDLDDVQASPVFTSGALRPSCTFDMRGDFMVAHEGRNGASAAGVIITRTFHGPFRESGLDTAAIYSDTTTHVGGAAPLAATKPKLAFRNIGQSGALIDGSGDYPPILLAYVAESPTASNSNVVLAKKITFPLNGAAPAFSSITIPANTNYDGTVEEQSNPSVVDSYFLSAALVENKLKNVAGGAGRKFFVAHADGTQEVMIPSNVTYTTRANMEAAEVEEGAARVAAMVYDGQNPTGGGSEHVFLQVWVF